MSRGTETEALQISGLLARGWAVAVTDYEGLGTPGQHTYMVVPSAGHEVLDVVRAAIRLPAFGLGGTAPSVLILMQHGLLDEVIPYSIGATLRDQYCAQGATVEFQTYPLADHVVGALVTALPATVWLGDRFAGIPATTTC